MIGHLVDTVPFWLIQPSCIRASPIFSGLGNKVFSIFPSFWDFSNMWKSCVLAESIEMVQYCVVWVLPSSSSLFLFSFSIFFSVSAHKHRYPTNFFNLDKPPPTLPTPYAGNRRCVPLAGNTLQWLLVHICYISCHRSAFIIRTMLLHFLDPSRPLIWLAE